MTVFILGAGFSRGYNPNDVPLINKFLDIAEKKNFLKPDEEHKELVEFIEKYFGDYHCVNIETLASFLTTELVPDIEQKYEYREKLYKQLVGIIIRTCGWLHKNPDNEGVKETFQKFADKLVENKINVVTFNYDLILDNLLKDTKKWSPDSGYGVEMKLAEIPTYSEKGMGQSKSEMFYLKLHGSLNWGRSILPDPYKGDKIVLNPYGSSEAPDDPITPIEGMASVSTSQEWNKYYESFIIPPILYKEQLYQHALLKNIWYIAKEILWRSDEIYIIGYSFPPTDFLTEFLIRQVIAISNSLLGENEKKIKVINKKIDNAYEKRVENIFQKSLFSIDTAVLEKNLNKGVISENLKKIFKSKGFPLSDNATIRKEKEDKWVITNGKKIYIVEKEDGKLNIYQKSKVEFIEKDVVEFLENYTKG